MKKLICCLAAAAAASLWAVPQVSNVTLVQNSTKLATLGFTLANGPAVVTIDIQTNVTDTSDWVTIGGSNFTNLVPANVNGRRLESGDYVLTWACHDVWPDQKCTMRAEVTAWSLDNLPDYMFVDLTSNSNVVFYASEDALPLGIKDDHWLTDGFLMKRIHAAGLDWIMGSPSFLGERNDNEVPTVVTLSEDYYIGVFETFEGAYKKIMGRNAWSSNPLIPAVYGYTYNSLRGTTGTTAGTYCWPQDGHSVADDSFFGKLRAKTGIDFDLPTGCQWEYACRGGTCTPYVDGSDRAIRNATNTVDGTCEAFINYCNAPVISYKGITYPDMTRGGTKKPNGYGLYDMIGNVWEWCLDYEPLKADFDGGDVVDYQGPQTPSKTDGTTGQPIRMARGGSTYSTTVQLSSSRKYIQFPATRQSTDTGFRVCCPAVIK